MMNFKKISVFFLYIAYAIIIVHGVIPHHHHAEKEGCKVELCSLNYEDEHKHNHHHHHHHNEESSVWNQLNDSCCDASDHDHEHVCHFSTDEVLKTIDLNELFVHQNIVDFIRNQESEISYYCTNDILKTSFNLDFRKKRGPPTC